MGTEKTQIGDRFKRYEAVSDNYLTRRTPVIARIDGRAFHTLTRKCEKPFDMKFFDAMLTTAQALCEQVQGCRLAYVQSDEISFLLVDYQNIHSEPWFDYRIQKMCSIAGSIAAVEFSQRFGRQAQFDARFFNVPENDVVNYFVWRQKDAERNSVNMNAQYWFSHKQLQGIGTRVAKEMLEEIGRPWEELPTYKRRGAAIIKHPEDGWLWDEETPVFSQDRDYIERLIPKE